MIHLQSNKDNGFQFLLVSSYIKIVDVTKQIETSNSFEHKNRVQNVLDKLQK